jgi:class 3 adenylate cyclase/predicted ATPase
MQYFCIVQMQYFRSMISGTVPNCDLRRAVMNHGPPLEDPLIRLSRRERAIAERFAEGLTYREIGAALYIAPSTVRTHIATIYRKLELRNKAALVRLWVDRRAGDARAGGAIMPYVGQLEVADGPISPHEASAGVQATEVGRRQLTILVAGLRDLFQLSQDADPEELGELIATYDQACRDTIARFEGSIAGLRGGYFQVLFGYPSTHEDDPERAVRAGLALIEKVAEIGLPLGRPLQLSVGIATGEVVIGDLLAEGTQPERAVVGGTPHLAARLEALAEPGTLLVAESTRGLLGLWFEAEPCSTEGLSFHRILGEAPLASRFAARQAGAPLPLVGRNFELELLLDRWQRAAAGEGQVVLLVGEPGIGKSRLVEALFERLRGEDFEPLRFQCTSYFANTPLHPILGPLERTTELRRHGVAGTRLAKLEAWHGGSDADAARAGFATLPPTAEQRREALLRALVEDIVGRTTRRPVLVAFEDAHWIDPSSLEFLDRLVARTANQRLLLLITLRPEFTPPPWIGNSHTSVLTLGRLTQERSRAMVGHVAAGRSLPSETLTQITERADGVPLFVEELTKTVLESKLLEDRGDSSVLAELPLSVAIPETLQASLMERLDRLGPVKEVAQIGAVIGREFSHELLVAVADRAPSELQGALDQLVSSELVFRRGAPPDANYAFKHALVQEAAYQSLLKSKRQQLHARIALALERESPAVRETGPEVLAHHLTEAGLVERAIPYWRRAGELAAGRSANLEAIAHLNKGLELVGTLPQTPEQLEEELALCLATGGPLIATKGYPTPEVEATYSRAWTLCDQLGKSAELFPVLRGLWNHHLVRGELERARDLTEQLVPLAEEQGTPVRRALARRALGSTLLYLGRFAEAATALNEGIAIDDAGAASQDPADLLLYTEDAGVVCRFYSALVLWLLGFPDRGLKRVEGSLALGRRLAHATSLTSALTWVALLHNLRGEFDPARRRAEAAIEITSERRLPQWLALGGICRGFALAGLGQPTAGIEQLRSGLAGWNGNGSHVLDTQWLGFIAQAHLWARQCDDALAALDRANKIATATGECHYQAELCRLMGVVLAETGDAAEAASWFQQAIDTARSQQARSLELRAATSLARLWQAEGRRAEAHALLAPLCAWFTEGLDTTDLKDAKALLDQLASAGNIRPLDLSKARGRHPARPKRSLTNRS